MKTVVIIPTYNEATNIRSLVPAVLAALPEAKLLIADDNSPDGTGELVKEMMKGEPRLALFSRASKEGLGKAYLASFNQVLADPEVESIVMMDADFSHDPSYLPALLAARRQADVVIGSRYVKGGGIAGWERWRYFLSAGGNLYARLITGLPVHDLTAGFYAISAARLRQLMHEHIDSSGYAFQIDLKYHLYRDGASFAEVPIIFHERRGGESKLTGHIVGEGLIAPWKLLFKR